VFLRIKCDDAVTADISGGHHKVRNSNYQLFVLGRVLFFVFFVFFFLHNRLSVFIMLSSRACTSLSGVNRAYLFSRVTRLSIQTYLGCL
jgi:hypothetical protein